MASDREVSMRRLELLLAASAALLFLLSCDEGKNGETDEVIVPDDDGTITDDATNGTNETGEGNDTNTDEMDDTSDGTDTPNITDGNDETADADSSSDEVGPANDTELPDTDSDEPTDTDTAAPHTYLDPVTVCSPSLSDCVAVEKSSGIYANYRKDFYYPEYEEGDLLDPNQRVPAPVDGGRFHITGIAEVSGTVTALKIDGVPVDDLIAQKKMVWAHPYPFTVTAGQPVWIAFHSQDTKWDAAGATGTVRLETTGGVALDGTFPVSKPAVPITYVTTAANYTKFLIHIHNRSTTAQTMTKLFVNGRNVTEAACIPNKTLLPGEPALWTLDLCTPLAPGELWTVTIEWQNAVPSTAGGRVIREFYPIETWQSTSDCPWPGSNQENYEKHRAASIDTFYLHGGNAGECGVVLKTLVENTAAENDFYVLATEDVLRQNGVPLIENTDRVAGYFAGDEADGHIYEDPVVDYATVPWGKYKNHTEWSWSHYPEIPVYLGGSRHRNVGAFAGCTDIQGFDFYFAACAPHITVVEVNRPAPRVTFDMLYAVREDHMPLPTWLYSQALGTMWGTPPLSSKKRVPNAAEQRVSMFMVLAAGAKGMMLFQTNMDLATENPATWEQISKVAKDVKAMKELLRTADYGQPLVSGPDFIATLLRAEKALVLVIVAIKTDNTVSEAACQISDPHWVFSTVNTVLTVPIASDIGIDDYFEVSDGSLHDVAGVSFDAISRTATVPVSLSDDQPTRLFVFTEGTAIRNEIQNGF